MFSHPIGKMVGTLMRRDLYLTRCMCVYSCSYKIVPREGSSSKVGITRARPLIGSTRICPNEISGAVSRADIESILEIRIVLLEEEVTDQILFLLIVYGGLDRHEFIESD